MKTTELRQFNLFYIINRSSKVHLPIEIPMKVLTIGVFEIECLRIGLNPAQEAEWVKVDSRDITGIPLTKGYADRLGYKPSNIKWNDGSVSENVFRKGKYFLTFTEKDGVCLARIESNLTNTFITSIDFVHELQNIHYLLTTEELIIND